MENSGGTDRGRLLIEWKKGEEENVIDFVTVIFTRCARSDSRT